jgi:coatomer subunit beta'
LLAAGSDDHSIQVIDFQARTVVAKLEAHEHNVTRVEFHPTRPILVTTGEDNLTIIWSSSTWKRENSLSSSMERGWALSFSPCLPLMAIGHDNGLTVHKFKNLGTPMSLDPSGKLVVAKGTDISVSVVKNLPEFIDGSDLNLPFKEGVTAESPPSILQHSPNGRYIATCGEGEWTVLTTLGFRSRAYGKGIMFGWASNSTSFATLNANRTIDVHSSFDDAVQMNIFAVKMWGGELIAASVNNGLNFYDWETQQLVRRIEIKPSDVQWSGDFVAVRSKTSIAVLAYNPDHGDDWEEGSGFEDAFDVIYDIEAKASSICWANGILLYTEGNKVNRISGGIILPTASLRVPVDIVGYLPREGVIILTDQQRNIIGANLPHELLDFEEAVVASEEEEDSIDTSMIPDNYRARTAKFLKQIGKLKLALEVANDAPMKFELALELNDLETAASSASDSSMWRRLARSAIAAGNIELVEKSLRNCNDYATLLLFLKSRNRFEEIKKLITEAEEAGQLNVAFSAAYIVGENEKCTKILLESNKYAEAAIFARSHCPSMTSECVVEWKKHMPNERMADAIADPAEYPTLFDELIPESE